jgi:SHO1 osmosensor
MHHRLAGLLRSSHYALPPIDVRFRLELGDRALIPHPVKFPQLNPLWFAIFLQLFVILGVLYILATDSIAMHRLQIAVFGAIAIVFTVDGVSTGIFSGVDSLNAMGAGWLVLSIVDIIWVLYFTSEEDSLVLHIFNMLGTGGLTPPSRRRRTRTQSSIHNVQGGNVYSANYSSGGIGSHDFDTKPGTVGYVSPNPNALRNQNSFGTSLNDNSKPFGSIAAAGSIREQTVGGAASIPDNDNAAHSPLMAPPGGISSTPSAAEAPPAGAYAYKARAMYACR